MNALKMAIEALEHAKKNSRGIDQVAYAKALAELVNLRNQILLYDKRLDDKEIAPTGDDYNEIYEMLGLVGEKPSEVKVGKIWWNADNQEEAQQWQELYLAKGAIEVSIKPEADRPVVAVIITLDRSRAKEILGHEVGEDEWLDLEDEPEANG